MFSGPKTPTTTTEEEHHAEVQLHAHAERHHPNPGAVRPQRAAAGGGNTRGSPASMEEDPPRSVDAIVEGERWSHSAGTRSPASEGPVNLMKCAKLAVEVRVDHGVDGHARAMKPPSPSAGGPGPTGCRP